MINIFISKKFFVCCLFTIAFLTLPLSVHAADFLWGDANIDGLNAHTTNSSLVQAMPIETKTTGQWYAEIHYNSRGGNTIFGVHNNDHLLYHSQGGSAWRWERWSLDTSTRSNRVTLGTQSLPLGAGDVIGIALDATNNNVTFFRNGIQIRSDSFRNFDPDTNIFTLRVAAGNSPTGSYNVNFALEASDFRFPIPEGYLPWLGSADTGPTHSELSIALDIAEIVQLSLSNNLGHNTSFYWFSNDNDIAVVDVNGRVTGVNAGITQIIVRDEENTVFDNVSVIVFNSDYEIDLRLALHLNIDETRRLYLNPNLDQIEWYSMDPSIVTVDNQGRVTGVGSGLAIIQAMYNDIAHIMYVRVA